MKKIFFAFSIFFLFVLVFPMSILASCSCSLLSLEQNAKKYDNIFTGRVTKLVKIGEEHKAHVQVKSTYKGYQSEFIDIYTFDPNIDKRCGFFFETGEEYFLYVKVDENGRYWTDNCSQTKPLAMAAEDKRELNKMKYRKSIGSSSGGNYSLSKNKAVSSDETTIVVITAILGAVALFLILGVGIGDPTRRKN